MMIRWKEWWSSTRIVTCGKIHNADELPGFVAVRDGFPVGLIIYDIDDRGCEVVCLNSVREGIGVGTALMDKVREEALKADCSRMWLITTNDNLKAVRYYQKRGFSLAGTSGCRAALAGVVAHWHCSCMHVVFLAGVRAILRYFLPGCAAVIDGSVFPADTIRAGLGRGHNHEPVFCKAFQALG